MSEPALPPSLPFLAVLLSTAVLHQVLPSMLDISKPRAHINLSLSVSSPWVHCVKVTSTPRRKAEKAPVNCLPRHSTEMSHYTKLSCATLWQDLFFTIFSNLKIILNISSKVYFNRYFNISLKKHVADFHLFIHYSLLHNCDQFLTSKKTRLQYTME